MNKILKLFLLLFFSIKLNAQYVDLGLPSGILWNSTNEGFYTHSDAVIMFGDQLPYDYQFEELLKYCTWTWKGDGYSVIGRNGNSIFLPAAGIYKSSEGFLSSSVSLVRVGISGSYWGYDAHPSNNSRSKEDVGVTLSFSKDRRDIFYYSENSKRSVRLVKTKY